MANPELPAPKLDFIFEAQVTVDPALPWAVPVLTHEFTPEELPVPIRNGK